jgi:MFS family permease
MSIATPSAPPVTAPEPAPPDAAEPTTVRYRVMAFLCVLSFLTYFDRVCMMRAQVDVRRDLNLNDSQIAWIFSIFWLAYGLFEIPVGWWGDRFGSRRTLTRIVLAWSLFTALSGSATGFLSLLAFRFLFGVGEAGAYPNMARIQSRWLPLRSRARAGGLLWLMARWGGAFSPVIFGTMLRTFSHLEPVTHVAAWRMGFWASGFLGLIWVAVFYPWFRDDPADKRGVNAAELSLIRAGRPPDEQQAHPTTPPGMWTALFTSRSLWAMALLYLCGSFGWSFFVSWMPKFLDDVHHVSFEKSEWASAMPLFLGGLSCLVGGWLSDLLVRRTGWRRFGRAIFPITGCSVAAAAMLGLRFVETPGQAVALMCVAAAAYDFGQGANWASIVDIGGLYAGTALGLINMIGNMGNFIQPPTGEWVLRTWGWPTMFVVYTGAYLAAATMWIAIDPRRKFYEKDEHGLSAPDHAGS